MKWILAAWVDTQTKVQALIALLALSTLTYTLTIEPSVSAKPFGPATGTDAPRATRDVRWLGRVLPSVDNTMLLHPLFDRSRQPWSAPAKVVSPPVHILPTPASPPPQAKLVGIVAGAEHKLAIVMEDSGPKSRVVREGDRLDGWIVTAIGRRDIVLQQDGRYVSLTFPHGRQNSR